MKVFRDLGYWMISDKISYFSYKKLNCIISF